jgi:hypothetical protein
VNRRWIFFGVELWSVDVGVHCAGPSSLEKDSREGDTPVILAIEPVSKSRVVWDCSSKWVVNSI